MMVIDRNRVAVQRETGYDNCLSHTQGLGYLGGVCVVPRGISRITRRDSFK